MNERTKKNTRHIKDVYINGSRVYVDKNGNVRTQFSEEIRKSGYMSVEELYGLLDARIRMIYELDGLL